MNKEEIRSILEACIPTEDPGYQPPTEAEWNDLEKRFSCRFPPEMYKFIELMAQYAFPGEILNVGTGPHNGNDTIELSYEFETNENPAWDQDMIPFYSIGNGDYFCVSAREDKDSKIYYFYADRNVFEEYCDSFESWILQLPQFLTGCH